MAVDSFTVCNTASSECSSNCRGEKMADVNKAPWTSQVADAARVIAVTFALATVVWFREHLDYHKNPVEL